MRVDKTNGARAVDPRTSLISSANRLDGHQVPFDAFGHQSLTEDEKSIAAGKQRPSHRSSKYLRANSQRLLSGVGSATLASV